MVIQIMEQEGYECSSKNIIETDTELICLNCNGVYVNE